MLRDPLPIFRHFVCYKYVLLNPVYIDTNKKLVTKMCGQNAHISNVKVGGTYNYHCVLKGWIARDVKLVQTRMNFALGTFCEQPFFQDSAISSP